MEVHAAGVDMVLSINDQQLVALKLLDLFMELSKHTTLPDGHLCDTMVQLRVADISARDLQVCVGYVRNVRTTCTHIIYTYTPPLYMFPPGAFPSTSGVALHTTRRRVLHHPLLPGIHRHAPAT